MQFFEIPPPLSISYDATLTDPVNSFADWLVIIFSDESCIAAALFFPLYICLVFFFFLENY